MENIYEAFIDYSNAPYRDSFKAWLVQGFEPYN